MLSHASKECNDNRYTSSESDTDCDCYQTLSITEATLTQKVEESDDTDCDCYQTLSITDGVIGQTQVW